MLAPPRIAFRLLRLPRLLTSLTRRYSSGGNGIGDVCGGRERLSPNSTQHPNLSIPGEALVESTFPHSDSNSSSFAAAPYLLYCAFTFRLKSRFTDSSVSIFFDNFIALSAILRHFASFLRHHSYCSSRSDKSSFTSITVFL